MADPPGSSLYNRVMRGVLYTREEAEGRRLRNPYDTIVEGMGLNRLTRNFSLSRIDGAFKVSDREAVEMASLLVREEGLFLGAAPPSLVHLLSELEIERTQQACACVWVYLQEARHV